MAHLRSIRRTCDAPLCPKAAVSQVYNTRNSPQGCYCGKHAQTELKRLQRREDESYARDREAGGG